MNITKKNGRIELLRFLFALIILLFHIQKRFAKSPVPMGDTGLYFFNHGCIGVEFFFLVSGYLLAAGCYKLRDEPCDFIGTETAGVMWKKIKHIFVRQKKLKFDEQCLSNFVRSWSYVIVFVFQ